MAAPCANLLLTSGRVRTGGPLYLTGLALRRSDAETEGEQGVERRSNGLLNTNLFHFLSPSIFAARRLREMPPSSKRAKHSRSGTFSLIVGILMIKFPLGNMKHNPKTIGALIRRCRKELGVTQRALAMTSGTGLRFIIEIERGKPTCQLGKALTVLQTLGIRIELTPPVGQGEQGKQ